METTNETATSIVPFNDTLILTYENDLLELLCENYRVNFPFLSNEEIYAKQNVEDLKRFIKDGTALLGGFIEKEQLVGALWAYERVILGEKRLHINHIIAAGNHRNRGVGYQLLMWAEGWAKEHGIEVVDLLTSASNENAISFYTRNNYHIKRVQMEKRL